MTAGAPDRQALPAAQGRSDDDALTDEELTALALAADPDAPLDPGAVPLDVYLGSAALLPAWYMPPVQRRRARGWRHLVVLGLVAAFLAIEAVGLCSTYGQLPFH